MALPANWRVVNSLGTMRGQLDTLWPERSRASDGTVADSQHSTTSDHYPHYVASLGTRPVVTARDITHDPAHGADCHAITEALRLSRDARLKYVIFDHEMFSYYPTSQHPAWTWRPYTGSDDPHTNHAHVSVVDAPISDSIDPWQLSIAGGSPMSAHTDALIQAWNEGTTTAPDGTHCWITDRQLSLEAFQRDTTAKLDALQLSAGDPDALAELVRTVVREEIDHALNRTELRTRPAV